MNHLRIYTSILFIFVAFTSSSRIHAVLPPQKFVINYNLTSGEKKCYIATIGASATAIALVSLALAGGPATTIVGASVGGLLGNEAFKAYIEKKRETQAEEALQKRMNGQYLSCRTPLTYYK